MADLDRDVKGKLAELNQKRQAEKEALTNTLNAQVATPVLEDKVLSTGQPVVEPPKPEAVLPVPGDLPPAPKEEPKEEPPLTAPVVEEPQKAWDDTPVINEPPVESKFDAKKFGSALGLDVKDETELVQTVTEKLAKAKQLETEKDTILQGIPENLKEAIEVAKKGGDWQSLVGSAIDVGSLDSLEVFDREYERNNLHRFKKPDGTVDMDAFNAELDAIPEALARFQGDNIKQRISQVQQQKKLAILQAAERQQMVFNQKLSEAARDISKALPKESFGITFEPKHSEYLYNGISNGTLIKKHFGDVPVEALAKFDPTKLLKAVALAEYGDKIAKYQYGQGQVSAKKELLSKTQNVQITPASVPAAPEVTDGEKPKSSHEKLKEFRDRHIKQGSL
jgi:hypothetical protein